MSCTFNLFTQYRVSKVSPVSSAWKTLKWVLTQPYALNCVFERTTSCFSIEAPDTADPAARLPRSPVGLTQFFCQAITVLKFSKH